MSDTDRHRRRAAALDAPFWEDAELAFRGRTGRRPEIDVYETEDAVVVIAEIPGVALEDVEVELDGDVLLLSGTREDRCDDRKVRQHQMEIDYGTFGRRVRLPFRPAGSEVEARYENGVLQIRLSRPAPVSRTIAVEHDRHGGGSDSTEG